MTAAPRSLLALVVVLLTSGVLAVICPQPWQPWVQFAAASLVALAATLRHRGRPLLGRGPRPRRSDVDVVDLVSPEFSLVGCVGGHQVVTTGVEISAGALETTEIGSDDPADFLGVRLPLGAVARQLDQGGVLLEGIDVVVHGRRAATGPDGEVYCSLVGPLALVSHRRVHLLLRFDLSELALTAPEEAGRDSPQRVIAVATERVRRSLVHHGLPCRVLDATELAERYVEAEADPTDAVGLVIRPGADPREVVDALTTERTSGITEVLRLRRVPGRRDVVDAISTVGLTGLTGESLPPSAISCHLLPSPRVLPVPGESLPDALAGSAVRRRLDQLDALAPPAHGCGQILGATRTGNAAAIQLAGPHLRSALLAADPAVCRQVAFRAVAAGYRVAVVTDVPDRWRPLLAIDDETRFRIVDPDASDAGAPVDAVFWDVDGPLSEGRIDALAGPGGPDVTSPTVIRVDADWDAPGPGRATAANPPDLVLDGRISGWISVEPRSGAARRVSVVTGPGEDAFIGRVPGPGDLTPAGAAPSASPDRR
ncbi:type VII secretion protein EccE [Dietzia sp. SLG310A2-38A2]|uniref:type VII secretion protein EccE n=1 Tax=Dietzia sp. SLG310A2-38A2 TaxID=1630643 RepID=UPI00321A18B3